MKAIVIALCASVMFVSVGFAQHSHSSIADGQAMQSQHPAAESEGKPVVITGYVRDIACLVRNPKAGAATTSMTRDCLEKCVRRDSPIGILTEEALVYVPISNENHDKRIGSP